MPVVRNLLASAKLFVFWAQIANTLLCGPSYPKKLNPVVPVLPLVRLTAPGFGEGMMRVLCSRLIQGIEDFMVLMDHGTEPAGTLSSAAVLQASAPERNC